jgi:putative lipase involved disintegration of autophagic bodies
MCIRLQEVYDIEQSVLLSVRTGLYDQHYRLKDRVQGSLLPVCCGRERYPYTASHECYVTREIVQEVQE